MARTWLAQAVKVVALSVAVLATTTPASAQQQEGTKASVPHQQTVSANPFGLMLRWWNVEFERKLTTSSTWGVTTSFLTASDLDFLSVNALYRYYPQGAALTGVFLGARAGVYHASARETSGSTFGLGFEIGYTWLLGAHRNVGLSMGAGATRLIGGDIEGRPSVLPNIRLLNVGIAF